MVDFSKPLSKTVQLDFPITLEYKRRLQYHSYNYKLQPFGQHKRENRSTA